MTTDTKVGGTKPKTKRAGANQRAILITAEKISGDLPVKKSGGRKSLLEPLVEQLIKDPGTWYRMAHGLKGTVGQTRTRLIELGEKKGIILEVETRTDEADKTMADCFARYLAPVKK